MELRGQVAVIRAHRLLIVAVVVLAIGGAAIASALLPKVYSSRVTLIVGQSLTAVNPDINQLNASQQLRDTYAQVATTRPVLTAVITTLHLNATPDALAKAVSTDLPPNSTLLTITAQESDPATAAAVANGIAAQLIAMSPTLQGHQSDIQQSIVDNLRAIQTQIDATQSSLDQLIALSARSAAQDQQVQVLEAQLTSLRATYASLLAYSSNSAANKLTVVEPAVADPTPSSPKPLINVLLALVIGLLLGLAGSFLLDYMDDSLRTPEEVELLTSVPVLGFIPKMRVPRRRDPIYLLATLVYPRSSAAESFRALRTNLEFAGVDTAIKSILVTSSLPLEGKTTVAANLAVAFAQAGRRTILVDADLRRPDLHRFFGIDQGRGLTGLLGSDGDSVDDVAFGTEDANLRIVTSGPPPPNPAELLASARMREIFAQLVKSADVVVIDSPPVNVVTDAAILAGHVDGTILVVDVGRTSRKAVRQSCEALAKVGARLIGSAVNRARTARVANAYGYFDEGRRQTSAQAQAVARGPAAARGTER
ncbi:MAG: polysaccharide biosynthesis tyrosine autokinase [Chloroflexi bacterium]|nr:polysaccharide biosynthesis tyrosine autokinase [Chloroflexota bacterium]